MRRYSSWDVGKNATCDRFINERGIPHQVVTESIRQYFHTHSIQKQYAVNCSTNMCVLFGNVMNALWKMGHVRLKQTKYSSLIRFFNTGIAVAREHTIMNIHHSQHTIGYVHHDNIDCVFSSGEKLNRIPFLVFHLAQDVALDAYDCVMVVLRIKGYLVAFRVFNLSCD